MRIGIDARELCGQPTGVGRYLGGLLQQWSTDDRARRHEFVLYAPEPLALPLDARRFTPRVVAGPGGTWWEQIRLPAAAARDHLDVFFAPAYTAPLRIGVPVVAAVHDISFVAHPEWFGATEGIRRRTITRWTTGRARAIITISEFTRGELRERLGVPAARIHVIPPGITIPPVSPPAATGVPAILYVGSIFNRRRIPDLIRAFAPLARAHPQAVLDLVGDNRTFPRQDVEGIIGRERLAGRVRWRAFVSDAELGALYGSARAFAFLSEYEGLGLTPLEALAAKIPPVLLDTQVAREACGDAALYVARGDVAGTTDALERLLFDEGTRARLLGAAAPVLARFDWPRAARQTLQVIEGAGS